MQEEALGLHPKEADYTTKVLQKIKLSGVQLRTKERKGRTAAQKRRRAARRRKALHLQRVKARKRLEGHNESKSLHGKYMMLRRGYALKYRKALARGRADAELFLMVMNEDEFLTLWHEAGKDSWLLKGRDVSRQAHMRRADLTKGWTLDNTDIWYQGQLLAEGARVQEMYFAEE